MTITPTSSYVSVDVTVHDPSVIDRVVDNIDGWQETYYAMTTRKEVIEHLVYNLLANGIRNVSLLDGWADCERNAVDFKINWIETEVQET